MIDERIIQQVRIAPGTRVKMEALATTYAVTEELKRLPEKKVKARALEIFDQNRKELAEAQNLLYAADSYSVLAIFQGMDASGKDGCISHVMSGVNPQGCQVYSFKQPSPEELDHTFLWRCQKVMPERGRIGIFNRSYYEEVLVVRIHPAFLDAQRLPAGASPNGGLRPPGGDLRRDQSFWDARFEDINAEERHLVRNGTVILKFFLNVSKAEQKKRFMDRLEDPTKNWKFSAGDVKERQHWDEYMTAFSDMLSATSTEWAPWYAIPADDKWAARTLVADIMVSAIQGLNLKYPTVSEAAQKANEEARRLLESEGKA